MSLTRRDFLLAGTLASLPLPFARLMLARAAAGDPQAATDAAQHSHEMTPEMIELLGPKGEEHIAMLLYPQFTALDIFGPHHMFINLWGAKVHLVAATLDPVVTDTGIAVTPTMTFADCPEKLSILCVPGGTLGTMAAMKDPATLAFLRDRGAKSDWVTSVCTGSLLLAAAGLLKGYKATAHWMVRDALRDFGAEPVNQRVVVDRNRITGGGVTAGIDFGLSLVARLRGEGYAKAVQLFSEYDPRPPFDSGSPEKADPATVAMLQSMMGGFMEQLRSAAKPNQNL